MEEDVKREDQIELTPKQRIWLKEYVKHGNASKAAEVAYDVKDRYSAAVIGHENLTKLNFAFKMLCEKQGLTEKALLQRLEDGLDANKVISANIYMKKGDSPVEAMKEADGCTKDFIEVPDNQARKEYLKLALKWLFKLDQNRQGTTIHNTVTNVNISKEQEKKKEEMRNWLNERIPARDGA